MILSATSGVGFIKYDIQRNGGGTTRELLESKMGSVKYNGATTINLQATVVLDKGKLLKWGFQQPDK